MFQVSRRADYAVRIMIELALAGEKQRLPARIVSQRTGVPKAFLHKITVDLVKASLVVTYTGTGGGLALAQPAHQINLLHIIEATEGPITINICLIRPDECPRQAVCPAHNVWDNLQQLIINQLTAVYLHTLAAEAKTRPQHPIHFIDPPTDEEKSP